jgi:hypothetical protein
VGKPSGVLHPFINTRNFLKEKNLTTVQYVAKSSATHLCLLHIKEFIQERGLTDVLNVAKRSSRSLISLDIRKLIQERSPMRVTNVEKHLPRSQVLLYIRKFILNIPFMHMKRPKYLMTLFSSREFMVRNPI